MIDKEIRLQINSELEGIDPFPLVDKWTEPLVPMMKERNKLANGESSMLVPDFLIPIQRVWAEKGPTVLTSYSHPENVSFYKYVGSLNLALVLSRLSQHGISIPKSGVLESWYDTIELDSSAKKPLSFGDQFTSDADLLSLGNTSSSLEDLELPGREFDVEKVADGLLGKLTNELFALMQNAEYDKVNRNLAMGSLKALLIKRINTVTRISRASTASIAEDGKTRAGQYLFEFGQRFGGLILSDPEVEAESRSSFETGIEGTLASDNASFNNLVFETLDYLIEIKGPEVLKDLAPDSEELFLGTFMGVRSSIIVDPESRRLQAINRKTRAILQQIPDNEIVDFVRKNQFIPFGKTETLALIAGGVTFHMGSERGEREKAIEALGITEEYKDFIDYLLKLRIGQDVEQGNYLIAIETVPGKYKPIPAILAYVLFGKKFIKSEIIKRAGKTKMPIIITKDDLKKLAAEKLFEEVKID